MSATGHRDPHSGPVSEAAWAADSEARARGRVAMFNATRPDGLDGWTMDLGQYDLMREHILDMVAAADPDPVALRDVVSAAIDRYAKHATRSSASPGARPSTFVGPPDEGPGGSRRLRCPGVGG